MSITNIMKNENKDTVERFNKIFGKLVATLQPEEREALHWFSRGLRAKTENEKHECYQKTRQILGGIILK